MGRFELGKNVKKIAGGLLFFLLLCGLVFVLKYIYNCSFIYDAYKTRNVTVISESMFKNHYLVSTLIGNIIFYKGGHDNHLPPNLNTFEIPSKYKKDIYYSPDGFEDNTRQKWLIVFLDRDSSQYILGRITEKGDIYTKHVDFSQISFENMKFSDITAADIKGKKK